MALPEAGGRAADDPLTTQTVGEAMGGAPAWFSAAFSQERKYVVSRTTLAEPLDWVNSSLLSGLARYTPA